MGGDYQRDNWLVNICQLCYDSHYNCNHTIVAGR